MAKLADAPASGAGEGNLMQVQVLLSAFSFNQTYFKRSDFFYIQKGLIQVEIIKFPDEQSVIEAMQNDELMISAIRTDGKTAVLAPLDYVFKHNILIAKAGYNQTDIDKFFRIIFDRNGANWTFVCPSDYKDISHKLYRIKTFYKDGLSKIGEFLSAIGYCISINIPERYKYFDMK